MSEPETRLPDGPMTGLFTPLQRKVVATALTAMALAVLVLITLAVLGALRDFLVKFSGVIWPLAVAGILALLLKPFVVWMRRRLKFGKNAAIFILFGLIVLVAVALLAFLVPLAITQARELAQFLQETNFSAQIAKLRGKLPIFIQEAIPHDKDSDLVTTLLRSLGDSIKGILEGSLSTLKGTASWLGGAAAKVAAAAIIPVYLFHLLSSEFTLGKNLERNLSFLPAKLRQDVIFLGREFVKMIVAFFRGQILIGLIMGLMLGLGFWAAGLRFGFFLGLGMGLLNVVPYLGSILGLAVTIPLAFFGSGDWVQPAVCLAIFGGVQFIEGNFLTPRIMGETTGLHPMVIIVAIFFWGTALDGLLGLILAIPLTAFVVVAWKLARDTYIARLSDDKASDPQDATSPQS